MTLTHASFEKAFPKASRFIKHHGEFGEDCFRCERRRLLRSVHFVGIYNCYLCVDCRAELYMASLCGREPEIPFKTSFNAPPRGGDTLGP
jgi:hypothetical protein